MKKTWLGTLVLVQSLIAVSSHAMEDVAVVQVAMPEPANKEAFEPRETLVFTLPGDLAPVLAGNLSYELDAIDITAVMKPEGRNRVYTPVQPLEPGEHELRVVYYGDDGSVTEVAYQRFEVREFGFLKDASITGQFDLGASQRVAERGIASTSDDFDMQGSASFQGRITTSHGQMNSDMDLLFLSDRDKTQNGRELDLGHFLVSADGEHLGFRVGHHAIAGESLLFDGYQKRGISASADVTPLNSELALFGMSSIDLAGTKGGLGINDSDNRYTGATWATQALVTETSGVSLTAGYLAGRESEAGFANFQSGNEQVNEGRAWSLGMDSYWFRSQVQLSLERAFSRYDFDGEDGPDKATSGDAWSALAIYAPALPDAAPDWYLGAEMTETGTSYRSLGHRFLPGDRRLKRLFSQLVVDKWTLNGVYGVEENNLDRIESLAVTETVRKSLTAAYTDYEPTDPGSVFYWLGTPSYSLNWERADARDLRTPVGFLANDTRSRSTTFTAQFLAADWQWALGYSYQEFDDWADVQIDSRTRSPFASASVTISERLTLTPSWSRQDTLNRDFDTRAREDIFALGADFALIPERLLGNLTLNVNVNRARNDPFFVQDNTRRYLAGQFTWRAMLPERNRPGLDVSFSFNKQDYEDAVDSANDQDDYQVFLAVRTSGDVF